ncbi:MAG: phosphoenolpyruvate--protein phosphotransferase [Betaproteobacteria bacterium TMED41]|nr:MAG: phosphoenolpyruvate--protein phosphotransferase [Betaproteobacteria bacterium TMED41]
MAFIIQGKGVGDAIVFGKAWILPSVSKFEVEYKSISCGKVVHEEIRFRNAVKSLKAELKELSSSIEKNLNSEFKSILETYQLILDDNILINGTKEKIKSSKCNAEWALVQQLNFICNEFNKINDPYFRERQQDIEQLVSRLLKKLNALENSDIDAMNEKNNFPNASQQKNNWILISRDISFSEISYLDSHNVSAFATELGSPTSHLAILARSLNIPAILGLQKSFNLIEHGEEIILDSECGAIIVGADEKTIEFYKNRKLKKTNFKIQLQKLKDVRCITTDGIKISLMGNIEQPEETEKALNQGAEGIGLFRSEFLFLNKNSMPSEDEQYNAYKKVGNDMKGLPVTIRTLDSGADKILPYLDNNQEQPANPALGLRAIRLCLANTDIFITQIRALLRASKFGNIKILLPLISGSSELITCRTLIKNAMHQLDLEKREYNKKIQIGAMIEVPSAAIAIESLLPYLDFVSLGTNDLIQYTLAIDRTNRFVSNLYDAEHPAILELIRGVVSVCGRNNIPVSICGEMAGNASHTQLLLNLGIRSFSMNCNEILLIKEKILKLKTNTSYKQ